MFRCCFISHFLHSLGSRYFVVVTLRVYNISVNTFWLLIFNTRDAPDFGPPAPAVLVSGHFWQIEPDLPSLAPASIPARFRDVKL